MKTTPAKETTNVQDFEKKRCFPMSCTHGPPVEYNFECTKSFKTNFEINRFRSTCRIHNKVLYFKRILPSLQMQLATYLGKCNFVKLRYTCDSFKVCLGS